MDEINKPCLLLVEGNDEVRFFRALLKLISADGWIEPEEAVGKTKIKNSLRVMKKRPNFSNVRTMGIITDADDSYESTFQSVRDALLDTGYDAPEDNLRLTDGTPKIGVFIMPNNRDGGSLENLCLKSVMRKPSYRCVEQFEKCIKELAVKPKNESKALALAYLATMEEECHRVGEGAEKDYWDFNSDEMKSIISFLKLLENSI